MKPTPLLLAAILAASTALSQTNTVETITPQEVIEAALYGKKEIIRQAIKDGFDADTKDPENRTPLMFASYSAQTEIVNMLLEAGAEVNAQDTTGTSALMWAASAPNGRETVDALLKAGAEINMVDKNEHFSALMWAASEGQLENVKLLVEKGADISLTDIEGDTAESFAAKAGHYAVARYLKGVPASKTNTPPATAVSTE